ncbi:MAG: DUF2272 domain-containing protein [Pyrinomonadaceae bacterium]
MPLRIHAAVANLRPVPNTTLAPLAQLPAGHPVEPTGDAEGGWRPCRATVDGFALEGFISVGLLREEINPMVDRLIELVGREFKFFKFGEQFENHPLSRERIKTYWLSFQDHAEPVSVAWSAAFISSCMKKADLSLSFKFSGRHTTYLSDSKRAKLSNDSSRAYWAVKLGERVVKVGDLVGAFRTGGACGTATKTYDSLPGDFCSHVDVVVAVRADKALAIGGNVGNTVTFKEIPLTPAGRVKAGNKRITTMARNF